MSAQSPRVADESVAVFTSSTDDDSKSCVHLLTGKRQNTLLVVPRASDNMTTLLVSLEHS